jgi:hypothetical protein
MQTEIKRSPIELSYFPVAKSSNADVLANSKTFPLILLEKENIVV